MFQFITQMAQPLPFRRHFFPADLCGLAEPGNTGRIERAAPQALFVMTAMLLRQQGGGTAAAYI